VQAPVVQAPVVQAPVVQAPLVQAPVVRSPDPSHERETHPKPGPRFQPNPLEQHKATPQALAHQETRRSDITDIITWPIYPYICDNNSAESTSDTPDIGSPAVAAPAPINVVPVVAVPANPPAPPAPFVPAGPSPIALAARAANAVRKDPQMVLANQELESAEAAYHIARDRVLAAWEKDPSHQGLLLQKQEAADHFRDIESNDPPPDELLQAAVQKLNASSPVTQMQEQAIAGDPDVMAARRRLDAAVAIRDGLWKTLLARQ
jgi:hypothetical protein